MPRPMILMRLREMTSCAEHHRSLIVLEEAIGERTLAIADDPEESQRLFRELSRSPDSEHPIYDFVESVLRLLEASPARIVLEHVPGAGLRGEVVFDRPHGDAALPCYPSDALALAR